MPRPWGDQIKSWPAARLVQATPVMVRTGGAVVARDVLQPDLPLNGAKLELLSRLSGPEPVSIPDTITELTEHAVARKVLRENLTELLHELAKRGFLTSDARPPAIDAPPMGFARPGAVAPARASTAALELDETLTVGISWLFRIHDGRFITFDYAGDPVLDLSVAEMSLFSEIARFPRPVQTGLAAHAAGVHEPLDEDAARALVDRLLAVRAIFRASEHATVDHHQQKMTNVLVAGGVAQEALAEGFTVAMEENAQRGEARGRPYIPVVPVNTQMIMPLAFGMIISAARVFEDGALLDDYHFLPSAFMDRDGHHATSVDAGGIFLFSDYIWSHAENLEHSRAIKERNPRTVVVHGGPDAPKYDGDVEAYFTLNPFVDVVVHGEGEVTFSELLKALAPSMRAGDADLRSLAEVPGLSYRDGEGVVRTGPRDRLQDINVIPSPYTSGLYDLMGDGRISTAMLETNRGCPYSCTFCDWGSATTSRIRKFDLERVFAELDWFAENRVARIFVTDANFGILERDVEIAEHLAHLHTTYGYPKAFTTNYAKNTVKHLSKIVSVLAEAGVLTEGLLSLQSMDEETLATIKRSNIKVEKYDALAAEFREARLPLMVDLMIGLPGSTTASLRNDFQQCINREVNAKVFQTEVLVNAPMNEPTYRAEHEIVTERADGAPAPRVPTIGTAGAGRSLIVSSSSYTRADYDEMLEMRGAFRIVENFATLRLVARFFHQETGHREVDFIESLRDAGRNERDRYPHISIAVRALPELMVPPVSWTAMIAEVRDLLVQRWGVEPSSALETVLQVQYSVLPDRDRVFPYEVDLAHDVGAWFRDILRAKDSGHIEDWVETVPHLATYDPVSVVISDPAQVCEAALGFAIDESPYLDWELDSPVARNSAGHAIAFA